jgi:hypothetical protein
MILNLVVLLSQAESKYWRRYASSANPKRSVRVILPLIVKLTAYNSSFILKWNI